MRSKEDLITALRNYAKWTDEAQMAEPGDQFKEISIQDMDAPMLREAADMLEAI